MYYAGFTGRGFMPVGGTTRYAAALSSSYWSGDTGIPHMDKGCVPFISKVEGSGLVFCMCETLFVPYTRHIIEFIQFVSAVIKADSLHHSGLASKLKLLLL